MTAASDRELLAAAKEAAMSAYAPYSGFRVGAVVVTPDGRAFTGVNVENAAYGSTMCAEATAIGAAIGAGARDLVAVAVATPDGVDAFPCGNCRQLMNEFGVERVLVETASGEAASHDLDALLPHSFGPENLPDED